MVKVKLYPANKFYIIVLTYLTHSRPLFFFILQCKKCLFTFMNKITLAWVSFLHKTLECFLLLLNIQWYNLLFKFMSTNTCSFFQQKSACLWKLDLGRGSIFSSPCLSLCPYQLVVGTLGGQLIAVHPVIMHSLFINNAL